MTDDSDKDLIEQYLRKKEVTQCPPEAAHDLQKKKTETYLKGIGLAPRDNWKYRGTPINREVE